jgi:hypothetical protein
MFLELVSEVFMGLCLGLVGQGKITVELRDKPEKE